MIHLLTYLWIHDKKMKTIIVVMLVGFSILCLLGSLKASYQQRNVF